MVRFSTVVLVAMCFGTGAVAEPVNIHMNCHIVDAEAQGLPGDMENVKIVVGQITSKRVVESLCVLTNEGVQIEPKEKVIAVISKQENDEDNESPPTYYYTCSGQDTAEIRVVDGKYLRTARDDEKEDNLGALGGCLVKGPG